MKTLYIDNYKGFTDTFIPIEDVNFFVGENSTGKTATLNLINLLSNASFWISPDFNSGEVELGYFNEIANKYYAKDKKYFVIAIEYTDKGKDRSKFFYMKFSNRNNLPSLCEYMCLLDDQTVIVNIEYIRNKMSVSYKIKPYSGLEFPQWLIERSFDGDAIDVDLPTYSRNFPLGFLRNIVDAQIHKDEKISKERTISITPAFNRLMWLAPIRAKAKRNYDSFKSEFSPEGDHMPVLLRKILSSKSVATTKIIDSLIKFGKDSALFDDVQIEEFGKAKGAPFAINILYDSIAVKITNVGYGISQILPLIIEILTSRGDTFAIQQPEVHLHPKAQSAFGDFIFSASENQKNRFLIETHSDFTINRFRYNIFKSQKCKSKGQVLFFERSEIGTKVTALKFNNNGQYPEEMPDTYGSFFIDEELKMLEF